MAVNYIFFWENLFIKENVQFTINLDQIAHRIAIKNKIKSYKLYDGKFKTTFSWVDHPRLDPEVNEKDIKKKI